MKKFLIMLCMLTCILGLTACGSEQEISQTQQSKIDYAEQLVRGTIIPTMLGFADDNMAGDFLTYTTEELEYLFENQAGLNVDGNGIMGGISSFNSSLKEIGEVKEIGEPETKVDGNSIVVKVPVIGENENGSVEVILENTIFMRIESCTLNLQESMGDLMGRAALNTLLGMGTVFTVLILISLIISSFGLISKMENRKKNKKEDVNATAVNNTIAQIVEKEELSDDLELVAVIAAAIAASNGSASTDGFVVRSIKRANKRKW